VRLAGRRLPLLRPRLEEGNVEVAVDGEAVAGVAPFATLWTDATTLAPGRPALSVRVGDEGDMVQPVTVDVRPGTVVSVEVQVPRSGRSGWRPPEVRVGVAPSGFSQQAVRDALTGPVSGGGPAERVLRAWAKSGDQGERAGSSADGSPLTGAWTGTARRKAHARNSWIGLAIGATVVGVVLVVAAVTGGLEGGDVEAWLVGIGGMAAITLIAVLVSRFTLKPVTLTLDEQAITLAWGRELATAPLADIDWADSDVSDYLDAVTLTRRADPLRGPKPAFILDLSNFDKGQRDEIRDLLRRRAAVSSGAGPAEAQGASPQISEGWWRRRTVASSHPPASPGWPQPEPAFSPAAPARSWVSRSGVVARVILWVFALLWLFFVVVLSLPAEDEEPPGPSPEALAIMWATVPVLAVFMVWAVRYYTPLTLTVDAAGLRIDRKSRSTVIAFSDIKSIELLDGDDEEYSIHPNQGSPRLVIKPRRQYWERTGTKPPGFLSLQWKLYRERFARPQWVELKAYLVQGVKAAGGDYYG